jgi:hypothetical protein
VAHDGHNPVGAKPDLRHQAAIKASSTSASRKRGQPLWSIFSDDLCRIRTIITIVHLALLHQQLDNINRAFTATCGWKVPEWHCLNDDFALSPFSVASGSPAPALQALARRRSAKAT